MLVTSAQAAGALALATGCRTNPPKSTGPAHGVLVGDIHGAKVAQQIFAEGGNAVDAVVAAAFVAGITSPSKCGIGGYGGSVMIAQSGSIHCIDFNSIAPAAARPDMYPLDAKGDVVGKVNFHGWLAAGVPGIPAGLETTLQKFGTKSLREVLQPAIAMAAKQPNNPRYS
jgi:gamma-glutamyltranspeptidase/glutathione hydrolase